MKVAILGCGLIGSSLAAALRQRNLAGSIIGYDPDPAVGARAIAAGLLDAVAAGPALAVRGADLVVLAAPVGAMPALLAQIAGALAPTAVVTDLGSTKADVVATARDALGSAFARFVAAHPIAGGERSGPEGADADLFEQCTVVIAAADGTHADALARVEDLWRACGARIVRMDAGEHDRLLASVSHLPHVLAFALVARIADEPDAQRRLALAGPGFRDFTRIAASSPVMWRDIALANRDAIGQELRALIAVLQRADRALAQGDAQWLQQLFETASRTRRQMDAGDHGR
jgi:prephenate dehydrogenase